VFDRPNIGWESEQLIEALSSRNCITRATAAEVLGSKKDRVAIKPLFRLLRDKDGSVRWRAAESLESLIGDEDIELLLSGVKDEHEGVRFWSVYLLGRCRFSKDVVPYLISALKDDNHEIRAIAAQSLELVGDERAIPPLLEAMRDEWKGARLSVFGAIKKLVSENKNKIDAELFLKGLEDDYPDVRFVSAFFLGELGDSRALTPLLDLIDDINEDVNVRQWAAYALGRMDDDRAFVRLIDLVNGEKSPIVRRMALRSLGEMALRNPEYVKQAEACITSVLEDEDVILLGLAQGMLARLQKNR